MKAEEFTKMVSEMVEVAEKYIVKNNTEYEHGTIDRIAHIFKGLKGIHE